MLTRIVVIFLVVAVMLIGLIVVNLVAEIDELQEADTVSEQPVGVSDGVSFSDLERLRYELESDRALEAFWDR